MVLWRQEDHVRAGGGHQAAKEPPSPWHGAEACRLGCAGVFAAGCPLWIPAATAASKSWINSMIQIQQVPSKITQSPESALYPLPLLRACSCSWLQLFSLQRWLL